MKQAGGALTGQVNSLSAPDLPPSPNPLEGAIREGFSEVEAQSRQREWQPVQSPEEREECNLQGWMELRREASADAEKQRLGWLGQPQALVMEAPNSKWVPSLPIGPSVVDWCLWNPTQDRGALGPAGTSGRQVLRPRPGEEGPGPPRPCGSGGLPSTLRAGQVDPIPDTPL